MSMTKTMAYALVALGVTCPVMAEAFSSAVAGDMAVHLPKPFDGISMGATPGEVRKVLPKASIPIYSEQHLCVRDISSTPQNTWHDADFRFANGKLAVAVIWSGHPRGERGGPDAPLKTAAFLSAASLFGDPDLEELVEDEECGLRKSLFIWKASGATITLSQSFSMASTSGDFGSASLVVDCAHPVPARESPFATPLTEAESVAATGSDTSAGRSALLPPEYGLRLGMGVFRASLARPGLRRDGESNRDGDAVVHYGCRLPERKGRGDISATFEDGKVVMVDIDWSYDDGYTADAPGRIREILDDTLRRLGPPTKRWTKETGKLLPGGTFAPPDPVDQTWHIWQWTKGDEDVVIEIRRSSDALRTLRASYCAGALRRLAPEALAFCGEQP